MLHNTIDSDVDDLIPLLPPSPPNFNVQVRDIVPLDIFPKDWVKPAKEVYEACHIPECGRTFLNTRDSPEGLILFDFPQNPELCKEWVKNISNTSHLRMDLEQFKATLSKVRVCSKHFSPFDVEETVDESSPTGEKKYRLVRDAIPTRNLPTLSPNPVIHNIDSEIDDDEVQRDSDSPSMDSEVRDPISVSPEITQEEGSDIEVITLSSDSEDEVVGAPGSSPSPVLGKPSLHSVPPWLAEKRIRDWVEEEYDDKVMEIGSPIHGKKEFEDSLPISDKCYIIEAIQETKRELSKLFNISLAQVDKIWKNRHLISSQVEKKA